MFEKLFRKIASPKRPTLEEEISAASQRALKLLEGAGQSSENLITSMDSFIEAQSGRESPNPPADLTSDLAALIGEEARKVVGGSWGDDPLFGLSLLQPGGIELAVLGPYQLVRKKWQLGKGLSLVNFFANLPSHLEDQSKRPIEPSLEIPESDTEEDKIAAEAAAQARTIIGRDLGVEIPATLVGLRSAERWLRGHFLLRTAPIHDFHRLGFLLGEVMRGLYGGEWSFDQARRSGEVVDIALIYPELPFFPIGRVLKLLVEQPEGNGLDDYVRLVPAARNDIRRDGFNPITGQSM